MTPYDSPLWPSLFSPDALVQRTKRMARMVLSVTDFGDFRRSALLERLRAAEATEVFHRELLSLETLEVVSLETLQRFEGESEVLVVFVMRHVCILWLLTTEKSQS